MRQFLTGVHVPCPSYCSPPQERSSQVHTSGSNLQVDKKHCNCNGRNWLCGMTPTENAKLQSRSTYQQIQILVSITINDKLSWNNHIDLDKFKRRQIIHFIFIEISKTVPSHFKEIMLSTLNRCTSIFTLMLMCAILDSTLRVISRVGLRLGRA